MEAVVRTFVQSSGLGQVEDGQLGPSFDLSCLFLYHRVEALESGQEALKTAIVVARGDRHRFF
jgi:hypothetical protein